MSLAAVEFLQAFDLHVSHSALAKWRIHMASCVCVCVCVCVWLGPVSGASLLWEDCSSVNMKRVCERLRVYMCHVCWQLRKTVSDRWTWSKWVSLHTRVHFSFQIHTWSHTHIHFHTRIQSHPSDFLTEAHVECTAMNCKAHTHTHTRKGKVNTKTKTLVIIHSTSCRAKPVTFFLLWNTKDYFFEECLSVFCPYNEIQ